MWGCPGLSERMPEIQWKGEIPAGYRPKDWKGKITSTDPEGIWDTDTLQPLHIDVEKNPFTGRPFFNEVIFWHKPSKTLLTTDLFWNYPASGTPNSEFGRDDSWELAPKVDSIPIGSKLWKFGASSSLLALHCTRSNLFASTVFPSPSSPFSFISLCVSFFQAWTRCTILSSIVSWSQTRPSIKQLQITF